MAEQKEVAKRRSASRTPARRIMSCMTPAVNSSASVPARKPRSRSRSRRPRCCRRHQSAAARLVVSGHEPAKEEPSEVEAATPKEHGHRVELAKKEAELMKAGQEADKERREKDEKKSGAKRAAETGIRMFARGLEPEVVAAPPDAPPEPK